MWVPILLGKPLCFLHLIPSIHWSTPNKCWVVGNRLNTCHEFIMIPHSCWTQAARKNRETHWFAIHLGWPLPFIRSVYHLAGLYKMIYKIFLSHQSLAYTMVIPWLYHGYTMVILCYTMVIPWLYHGYTMVIPWLYYDYTMVMAHFHSISHDFTVDAWVDLVDVKIAAGSSGSTVKTTSLGPTMRHWESCASAWPSSHP